MVRLMLIIIMIAVFFAPSAFTQAQTDEENITIYSLDWNPTNDKISLSFSNGIFQIWDANLKSLEYEQDLTDSDDGITHITWCLISDYIIFSDTQFNVYLLDYPLMTVDILINNVFTSPIYNLSCSPDGDKILISQDSGNPNFHVWSIQNSEFVYSDIMYYATDIIWHPELSEIAISHFFPNIEFRSSQNFKYQNYIGMAIDEIQAESKQENRYINFILEIDWNNKGDFIISGSVAGNITLWSIEDNKIIFDFIGYHELTTNPHLMYAKDVWFSTTGDSFSSITSDGTYRTWETTLGELLLDFNLNHIVNRAEISPDKTQLAYVDSINELHIIAIYDLIHDEISLKLNGCVTAIEVNATLTNLLTNNDIDTFITTLEAERGVAISETCADDLVAITNLLIEVETTP